MNNEELMEMVETIGAVAAFTEELYFALNEEE